jgi:hypothetical protein
MRVLAIMSAIVLPAFWVHGQTARDQPITNVPAHARHIELAIPLTTGASREIAATGQRVTSLKASVDVPPAFDARSTWPVLLVCAPSGSSAVRASSSFTNIALGQGWIVVAVDGPRVATQLDNNVFAWEMISSLLTYLRTAWPQSKRWPFVCAGFSGGAKRAAMIAAEMARRQDMVAGVFMGGCNEDRASLGYRLAQPDPAFLNVPMFVSNGTRDSIAGTGAGLAVKQAMEQTGFRNVRFEKYDGEHRLSTNHLEIALKWFASLQRTSAINSERSAPANQ